MLTKKLTIQQVNRRRMASQVQDKHRTAQPHDVGEETADGFVQQNANGLVREWDSKQRPR